MAGQELKNLRRELDYRTFQFTALSEFSAAVNASYDIDQLFRAFFAHLMGSTGISRTFYCDRKRGLLRKRGFKLSAGEADLIFREIRFLQNRNSPLAVSQVPEKAGRLRKLLQQKKIHHLLAVSGGSKSNAVIGLGHRFNRHEIGPRDLEFAELLARFSLQSLDNIFYWRQLLEKEKMQYEMRFAREIQRSLLPRVIPVSGRFEIAVRYFPTSEVGGDFYDILAGGAGCLPLVIADVEGKGLSAALLAASSQAVFRSLAEVLGAEPAVLVRRANSILQDLFGGRKFVTLLWMLLDERAPALTYVNAGHSQPLLCREGKVFPLEQGGLPLGVFAASDYQQETVALRPGDLIAAMTDGVSEITNQEGLEFSQLITELVLKISPRPAAEIADTVHQQAMSFSRSSSFKDDFTLLIIKVK